MPQAALGSYEDFKLNCRNFQRMQGISSLQSPSCTPSPTANKDKRKMPGSSLTRDPISDTSSSHAKSSDLRNKINKSRRSCESREVSRGSHVTHRSLKERIEKGGGENLIEFTRLPGSKVKTEESGDERKVKQVIFCLYFYWQTAFTSPERVIQTLKIVVNLSFD